MNKSIAFKLLWITLVFIVLAVPQGLLEALVRERASLKREATADIVRSASGPQTVKGPLLVVPYSERFIEVKTLTQDDKTKTTRTERLLEGAHIVFPQTLDMTGAIRPEIRYRGLHKVTLYEWNGQLSGQFALPSATQVLAAITRTQTDSVVTLGAPFLALGVDDVRGLGTLPVAKLGENALSFAQGSRVATLGQGIHAPLDAAVSGLKTPTALPFSIAMSLGGTERLGFVPLGDQNSLALTSSWPHPQFGGQFLPRTREISDAGFSAKWAINALATQAQAQLQGVLLASPGERSALDTVNVALVDPVNVYLQAERAIKYGILFIGLTFAAFFFFETVKALPVHPIQYGLVGLALVTFFLLLVALSEHLAFYISYLIACGCCISIITIYLIAVMKSRARGLGFGAGLVALYGALYGLLVSEQNSLVLGALMLFVIVAGIMIGTRHINWFALGASVQAPKATPLAPGAAAAAQAGVNA